MDNFKFKTNINCNGCISAVKPHLDKAEGIASWKVDIADKDKILTVESNGITQDEIIATVQKAGYNIEVVG